MISFVHCHKVARTLLEVCGLLFRTHLINYVHDFMNLTFDILPKVCERAS